MSWPLHRGVLRSLRFRLAVVYTVLFLLTTSLLGGLYRARLGQSIENNERALLEEEWATMKGYLRVEAGKPVWTYDPEDQDEVFAVERVRRYFVFANQEGELLRESPGWQELPRVQRWQVMDQLRQPQHIVSKVIGRNGQNYLVCAGLIMNEQNRRREPYYAAIARPLGEPMKVVSSLTREMLLLLPALLVLTLMLSWLAARRALAPLNSVNTVAQRVTAERLKLHIPRRGANDELDALIDSFNAMAERLHEQFTSTRQFSTDVSHELRTPLTVIRGHLEVALYTAETVEQCREAMLTALADVERLSNTVRSLLQLAQAESGQVTLQRQTLDLGELAQEVCDHLVLIAADAGLELHAELPRGCIISADRVQIERLLINLVNNSIKYTPAGGQITVVVRQLGEMVQLTVADTGIGIAPEALPHIFDRFYRARQQDNIKSGLGLGLSFVAWIVKAHGGTIHVASNPGAGTRFAVQLPTGPRRTESEPRAAREQLR